MFFYLPLSHPDNEAMNHAMMNHDSMSHSAVDQPDQLFSAMKMHFFGMWLTFTISTVILVYFVNLLSSSLAQQLLNLASFKEKKLRDDHLIDLATQSANAAHNLSTPINSMQLLIEELSEQLDYEERKNLAAEFKTQLNRCSDIIQTIRSGIKDDYLGSSMSVEHLANSINDQWTLLKPEYQINITIASSARDQTVYVDSSLLPAIINVLDNAARHNYQQTIELEITRIDSDLSITFENIGDGLSDTIASQLGQRPLTQNARETTGDNSGMGIGFFLASSSIDRLGGSLQLVKKDNQRVQTIILLPLTDAQEVNQ
jgi:two-component system sensor histidine kinase RegB